MSTLTVSLVIYKTPPEELEQLFASLQTSQAVTAWVVVDNAATESTAETALLRQAVLGAGGRYVAASGNLGFGGGHNLGLTSLADCASTYHLLVNPDIRFGPHLLPELIAVLDARPTVGWVMPRIVYPDGRPQYLCKLLPSPLHFVLRRFLPGRWQGLVRKYLDSYELRGLEQVENTVVPFLSGCFVMARRSVLEAVGGFDDRYFLYMEDVDLCRRMAARSELLYYPSMSVTHGYHRGSHRNWWLTWVHIRSSITYFNKWGWILDAGRKRANQRAIDKLREVERSTS